MGLTILLGAAATFAFAPFGFYPLVILSLAGLLCFWLDRTPGQAFRTGFLYGLGFFGAGVYWVYHSVHYFGGLSFLPAFLITALLVTFLSLYPALAGYYLNRFFPTTNGSKLICAFPAFWMLSEWARGWVLTGFPWLLVGYSQTNSFLRGYAPILSVYGVSLVVAFSAGVLVQCMLQYRQGQMKLARNSFIILLVLWLGGFYLTTMRWATPQANSLSISMVQGNIPQSIKWSPEHLQLSFDRYEELSEPLWGKTDIIIWPEAAIPTLLDYAGPFVDKMEAKAKATNTTLILGIPMSAENNTGFYNAILALGDSDRKIYRKRRLVPYGEYIPFSSKFANLFDIMKIPMANTISGNYFQDPFVVKNTLVLPSVCYEVAFPLFMFSSNPELGYLLTVTNDAWFGDSAAQAQHLQMASMVAMELQRPFVFASNDGITAIIGPDGVIKQSVPTREVAVLNGRITPTQGLTPYMRFGTDPAFFLMIGLLAIALRQKLAASFTRKNKIKTEEAREE